MLFSNIDAYSPNAKHREEGYDQQKERHCR